MCYVKFVNIVALISRSNESLQNYKIDDRDRDYMYFEIRLKFGPKCDIGTLVWGGPSMVSDGP